MTLKELKERIDSLMDKHADDEVCIPNNKSGVGGTPATGIRQVNIGFDWNRGLVFIVPENMLQEIPNVPKMNEQVVYKDLNGKIKTGKVNLVIQQNSLFLNDSEVHITRDPDALGATWEEQEVTIEPHKNNELENR